MKIELNVSQFRDLFYRNTDYKGKYSYKALEVIYNWYEQNEPDYDFDMGEIVTTWSDFTDFSELENDYFYLVDENEYNELEDEEEKTDFLIKEIKRSHIVIKYNSDSSFLIME